MISTNMSSHYLVNVTHDLKVPSQYSIFNLPRRRLDDDAVLEHWHTTYIELAYKKPGTARVMPNVIQTHFD